MNWTIGRPWVLPLAILSLAVALEAAAPMTAEAAQYRAFWVDTFNTRLNNRGDVAAVVANAKAARANAIFAQVRRRGDSFYRISLEPLPDGVPIEPGFDPLQSLIEEAHGNGIEVHAFVVIGSIWNSFPTLPSNPNHVFNLHGFNQATGRVHDGRDNWLTRTLLPDQNSVSGAPIVSMGGYRFGGLFFMDPGHPDAASYTVDVLTHLTRSYQIDGLHLDYIRYPEISVSGQTPATGTSVGYNDTSVARFQRRYGIAAGAPPPAANDPLWSQWRRDQVGNLVRRIYLNAIAARPELKVSAALIAFGNGPTTETSWSSAEAYWRVYQDWRAWTEEGILDLAIPMVYKREHVSSERSAFDQWIEWTKNHQYGRSAMIGQGAFVNAVEGTIRQTRRALAPSGAGHSASGVIFFSMAVSNASVSGNPYSSPPGQDTPARPFAELAAGLVTGKSVSGAQFYEDPIANPSPVFGDLVLIPELPWKTNPQGGHLMGTLTREDGSPLDTATVTVRRVEEQDAPAGGRALVTTASDGGGFFGAVDLAPGLYQVTVSAAGQAPVATECAIRVRAGGVSSFEIVVGRDGAPLMVRANPQSVCPRSPVAAPRSDRNPRVIPGRG